MKNTRVLAACIAAAALMAGFALAYALVKPAPPKFESTDISGVDWGRDFHLTGDDGRPHRLADFRGKVVAVYFGYTSCPDECPTTLASLAHAIDQLGADAGKVQGFFITVDPQRDTRKVLARYVRSFSERFMGLYGDVAATRRATSEFKVLSEIGPAKRDGSYSIDHTDLIYVFDPKGRLRLAIRGNAAADSIAHDLRLLLDEPA